MTFIKKIFEKKVDEDVHKQFTRFSKGVFENRALTEISKGKDNIKVKMSYDLIQDIIARIAQDVSKADIEGKLIKGKKKTEIASAVSKEELQKMVDENDFALLDVTAGDITLKCKKSLPKPGKNLDVKFASATLPLSYLSEFLFDQSNGKKITIAHTFTITDIEIPNEYKNNFELARVHAKRKGKIKRILTIDGQQSEKEIDFIA
jgi:hypothetical protein